MHDHFARSRTHLLVQEGVIHKIKVTLSISDLQYSTLSTWINMLEEMTGYKMLTCDQMMKPSSWFVHLCRTLHTCEVTVGQ